MTHLLSRLERVNLDGDVQVLGIFPKQCFSFARMKAETEEDGYYVEGFVFVLPELPISHAWYESADGSVIDGTSADKSFERVGVKVPVSDFKTHIKNKVFCEKFEKYGEMPYHRSLSEIS